MKNIIEILNKHRNPLYRQLDQATTEIEEVITQIQNTINCLQSIKHVGGNLSDDNLMSRTGANDAVARGIMAVNAREYAKLALQKLGVE